LASTASVLASWPRPFARSRAWRGFIQTTSKPAATSWLKASRSTAPVASRTICLGWIFLKHFLCFVIFWIAMIYWKHVIWSNEIKKVP
jgi:hypothetical protein